METKPTMNDDDALLRSHVEHRSEQAFTELVQRHIGLVYATALRQLGQDTHLAEDVTQSVFTDLARKAAGLCGHATVAGWLYVSTRKAAAAVVRREQRRKRREQVAHSMHLTDSPDAPNADFARLRSVLDDALVELKPDEQEAIVLRFFEKHTLAEVGAVLRVTEEAARKRVDRALEKLHGVLTRRGITSTSVALGAALSQAGAASVPAGLAAKVAGVAVAQVGAASAFSFASLAATLIPPTAAALVGALGLIPQHRTNHAAAAELAELTAANSALPALRTEVTQLARTLADARELERAAAELPDLRATLAALPPPPPLVTTSNAVTITPQGTISWEGEHITLDHFESNLTALHLAASNGESKLLIHARGVQYPQMIYALDEARKAGVRHIVVDSDAMPDPKFPFSWF
ncbi:sigma-70 family RNA polymerase sigma factor [Opitutus terrae]|uniref:RNA polymerase, sigma-24 subunit, ECF subfamily n=1 Tax=Opitutus terrae (strain DSM 11246 / JCM 15787 / PB90-1) TaxID=452637 RepID=B1ZNY6_OPITP|nr:sigma-70 family RNA polymerase sigma factor [Opitutus terrae]ACB77475.1 RNA polymerase, sigma-24 subunit, ECF subfamily [Opitutus terrae PB90-1]